MRALPLAGAAAELGIAESTLRDWIRRGAPAARPKQRGRGHRTLVDPEAIRAWRALQGATAAIEPQALAAQLLVIAARAPDRMGDAVLAQHREMRGPDKKRLAAALAIAGQACIDVVLDLLREQGASIPEPNATPAALAVLAEVARS